jgi:hypothetical protein
MLDEQVRVSFASTDVTFERHKVPAIERELHAWSGSAWRGERVHAQAVVWSKKVLSQLRAAPIPLSDPQGRTIPAGAMRIRFVRYVLSELPPGTRRTGCGDIDQKSAYLLPDVLDTSERFDLPAETARPFWITIDVPVNTIPGDYSGELAIRADGGFVERLTLKLEVQAATVPAPRDWRFRVDLWQNPWAVAHQHRVAPWSEAHLAILRRHLRTLADLGQTYVSAYITHSPWKDDTYIADATMVEWIREKDGSFTFDYRVFDTYIETAIAAGIDDAISCFTLIPWDWRVRYLDRATGSYVWTKWEVNSAEYKNFWPAFLADLRDHLIKRGWFEKTYLEVNERGIEDTVKAIRIARSDSPDWKITYAGNFHRELVDPVDDLCTAVANETPPAEITGRRRRGQTNTFYVACEPAFPNNFPFSPTAENVWMGWHAAAMGMDGFLRWAWDSWPSDPLLDSRHFRFPAGDTFLIYPGPLWSIRAERMREGFADFEKLRIVRQGLAADSGSAAREAEKALNEVLAAFTWNRVRSTAGATVGQDVQSARNALARATRIAFRLK